MNEKSECMNTLGDYQKEMQAQKNRAAIAGGVNKTMSEYEQLRNDLGEAIQCLNHEIGQLCTQLTPVLKPGALESLKESIGVPDCPKSIVQENLADFIRECKAAIHGVRDIKERCCL